MQKGAEISQERLTELEDQLLLAKSNLANRSTSWFIKARAFLSKGFRKQNKEQIKYMEEAQYSLDSSLRVERSMHDVYYAQGLTNLEREFQLLEKNFKPIQAGKDTLRNFYWNQGELLKKYQIKLDMDRQRVELERYKQEHGTITEVAQKYGAYIVHGITLSPGGTNNSVLEHHATWKDKLMVLAFVNPPLSASVFREGGGKQFLWGGGIGVVIKEGVIADVEAGDLASVSTSTTERRSGFVTTQNIESYQKRLERAVNKPNTMQGYNEVILEFGAKPGAVFINLDQMGNASFDEKGIKFKDPYSDYNNRVGKGVFFGRIDRLDYNEIFEVASVVGLPVVIIKDGVVHEASLSEMGGIIVGEKLPPQDLTSMDTRIPEENLPEIQRNVRSVLKTTAIV